jgi:hypothetical protein
MNIHQDIPLSIEQLIDEFSVKARRIKIRFDCIFVLYNNKEKKLKIINFYL